MPGLGTRLPRTTAHFWSTWRSGTAKRRRLGRRIENRAATDPYRLASRHVLPRCSRTRPRQTFCPTSCRTRWSRPTSSASAADPARWRVRRRWRSAVRPPARRRSSTPASGAPSSAARRTCASSRATTSEHIKEHYTAPRMVLKGTGAAEHDDLAGGAPSPRHRRRRGDAREEDRALHRLGRAHPRRRHAVAFCVVQGRALNSPDAVP